MNKYIAIVFLFTIFLWGCKSPEARRPVTVKTGAFFKASVERNKELFAFEEQQIKNLIKNDSLSTYHAAPNGFWYTYNTQDSLSTRLPKPGDLVTFDYDLKTLAGVPFYTKEELGTRTYRIDKEELISGLRHGIKTHETWRNCNFLITFTPWLWISR